MVLADGVPADGVLADEMWQLQFARSACADEKSRCWHAMAIREILPTLFCDLLPSFFKSEIWPTIIPTNPNFTTTIGLEMRFM